MPGPSSVIVAVLLLLISLLLLNTFDINYVGIAPAFTSQRVDQKCNCKAEKLSSTTFHPVTKLAQSTVRGKTGGIPRLEWYHKLMKSGVGRKGGTKKMDISLVAAYQYPDQINVMITSRNRFGDTVYCRYFDKFRNEIGTAFKTVVFPEFNAHCTLRNGTAFMSLTDTPTGVHEYPVPVVLRTQREPEHFFSVCVAPIYGPEPKWLLLAELIEHYKLQGASHFYVYSKYIDEYSRVLLDDYIRTGEAEAIILHDRFQRDDSEWQVVQLQECLLRARRHSRWIAFIDLDERLTMTDYNGTIESYLRNISNPKIGGIQFRQRWILKNESSPLRYAGDNQVSEWMPTRRYHNTSTVGPPGHTAKCIVDPEKVLAMSVHYVQKFFDDHFLYPLDPKEGVVRHYRDVSLGNWGKVWLKTVERMGRFSMTDYPMLYGAPLLKNVQNRVRFVFGGDNHTTNSG
ncbi:Glycosyltransferase family 92 protein [Trichostrongylus colubriformis]|uniref:Glycosyltransferase family 92 protein n=1 Tax=Trichostrongylus colubriformis TaxID=6319 RepID=A0AAN8G537_TRICO